MGWAVGCGAYTSALLPGNWQEGGQILSGVLPGGSGKGEEGWMSPLPSTLLGLIWVREVGRAVWRCHLPPHGFGHFSCATG